MKPPQSKTKQARWFTLVQTVEHGHPGESWDAAMELIKLGLRRPRRHLLKAMQTSESPENREAAAYALFRMNCKELISDFIACVADEAQAANVRGQAAEALGDLGCFVRKNSRLFRQAEEALMMNLVSSSPVVRFWCCFALGSIRSKRAVKQLTKLRRQDHTDCPGWWKVSEEAADALHSIRRGYWPEHERSNLATH